jgi:Cytidylate kinase-like family
MSEQRGRDDVAHKVVCISREHGASAPRVAQRVADSLNFRLIDEDIVTRAALESGVDRDVIADLERGRTALVRMIEGFGAAGVSLGYVPMASGSCAPPQPAGEDLRVLIRSVIADIAASGGVVILAHAASLALATRDDVLRVLITASREARARRLAQALGIDATKAARAVKRSDAGRADYLRRFYGIADELPVHYDLVINTDRLTPEDAARLIVATTSAPVPPAELAHGA